MSQNVIGFVAFRKGSKRLPLKNGKLLGDKPLYQITLDKLIDLKRNGCISHVVASTDCSEWQENCLLTYGDEVIVHYRSALVSGDLINEGEVILDFFRHHPLLQGAAVMLTLCTYPFLKPDILLEVIHMYRKVQSNVYTIKEAHHMPQKLLRLNEKGQLRPYIYESMNDFEANTKLLMERYPLSFYSTGAFLIHQAYAFLSNNLNLWSSDSIYGVIDDSIHLDIDTEEDFILAQLFWPKLSQK